MWPRWQQHQREADNGLRRHNIEERVLVPAFATRTQLSDVRIQLALLDRDFDYRGSIFIMTMFYFNSYANVCFEINRFKKYYYVSSHINYL